MYEIIILGYGGKRITEVDKYGVVSSRDIYEVISKIYNNQITIAKLL